MDKRAKIILGVFFLVLLIIIFTEIVRPKPLNWSPSYTSTDKIPFGCYVLSNELKDLFKNQKIKIVDQNTYLFLTEKNAGLNTNYIFINNYISFDKQELNQLLNYVNKGNNVFIAADNFGTVLTDSLKISTLTEQNVKEDTVVTKMYNPVFGNKEFAYSRGIYKSYFTSFDTINSTTLGKYKKIEDDDSAKVNFIKVKIGNGNLFLNTVPQAFTNYYLLNKNAQYVANCFSYLNEGTVYWDDYKKTGRELQVIDSPMRFVLKQESLKWAYYLLIISLILFMIFRAKREQRIIPVVKPLENSSVEFTKTIGDLYFQYKDYSNIISKKITYFMDYIRNHYYLNTEKLDDAFIKKLSVKASKNLDDTTQLINYIKKIKTKPVHTEQELVELNKRIEAFKKD
ncbi:DUF4350 domain-containing protein [Abyssalbus ytuae]|uniref:DUF4350 domain-containing protein n=1 Tax=Abyssalbus ytuae TaxID=2926907 RepID=A0A9E6ZUI1_9FLAO|nr:DUF4350 domain-containing protein [Abyssalbus ytuae]UOB18043.1 DUF4350 domain-containing protein [Abyssalbus ytuae]